MSSSNTFACSNPECKDYEKEQDSDYQSVDCPEYCLECVLSCVEKHLDNAFNPKEYKAKILSSETIEECAGGYAVLIHYTVKIGKKTCKVSYLRNVEGESEVTLLEDSKPKLNDDEMDAVEEVVTYKNMIS